MKSGYEMVDEMFLGMKNNLNHELSVESAFEFISFYGLIWGCTLPANAGKKEFVGRAALETLDKAFVEGRLYYK